MHISFLILVGFFFVGLNICSAADVLVDDVVQGTQKPVLTSEEPKAFSVDDLADTSKMVFEVGTTESQKEEIVAGRYLKEPFIRLSVLDYVKECKTSKRRLALGAGHIFDVYKLCPEYQPTGGQALRDDYEGKYDFQQYTGWLTASAEVHRSYGSDIVFNITKKAHQEAVFVKDAFDIVLDTSGHPIIQTSINYKLLRESLRPGGVAILPIYLDQEEDGTFICGHIGMESKESSASGFPHDFFQRKLIFRTLKQAQSYWSTNLEKAGFKGVTLHESPILLFYKDYLQKNHLKTMKQLEDLWKAKPDLINELNTIIAKEEPIYAEKTEAAKYDNIFKFERAIVPYYIIAKVPATEEEIER